MLAATDRHARPRGVLLRLAVAAVLAADRDLGALLLRLSPSAARPRPPSACGSWIWRCAPGTARRPISCSARVHASSSGSRSRFLTPFILLVGFFNERRRLLHDILVGTVVINNPARAAACIRAAAPRLTRSKPFDGTPAAGDPAAGSRSKSRRLEAVTQHSRDTPQFYLTAPSPCPYLPGQEERKVFTHLVGERAAELNDLLTHGGFRRSQSIAYRPACETCRACVSVRVVVDDFQPDAQHAARPASATPT